MYAADQHVDLLLRTMHRYETLASKFKSNKIGNLQFQDKGMSQWPQYALKSLMRFVKVLIELETLESVTKTTMSMDSNIYKRNHLTKKVVINDVKLIQINE